jgi:hypothetical protein
MAVPLDTVPRLDIPLHTLIGEGVWYGGWAGLAVHSLQCSTAQFCELMSMGPELISICIPIQSWKHRMSLSEPPEPAYR